MSNLFGETLYYGWLILAAAIALALLVYLGIPQWAHDNLNKIDNKPCPNFSILYELNFTSNMWEEKAFYLSSMKVEQPFCFDSRCFKFEVKEQVCE